MTDIIHYAQFNLAGLGVPGLTVTVDVDQYVRSTGARTAVVTGAAATELRDGLYSYLNSGADLTLYDYVAVFKTNDITVDDQVLMSVWVSYSIALIEYIYSAYGSLADIIFYAQFKDFQNGIAGLTVTVDMDEVDRTTGTRTALLTGVAATEGRNGVYFYRLAGASLVHNDYLIVFKTADSSVDDQEIPVAWSDNGIGSYVNYLVVAPAPFQVAPAFVTYNPANCGVYVPTYIPLAPWVADFTPYDMLAEVRAYRDTSTSWRIRLPIPNEPDPRRVIEYLLSKDTAAAGGAVPNTWWLTGCKIIDLDGVDPDIIITRNDAASPWEFAYAVGLASDTLSAQYGYYGSTHKNNQALTYSAFLDGFDLASMPIGGMAYGNQLTIEQTMTIFLPKDSVTPIGVAGLKHTFTVAGLRVWHSHIYTGTPACKIYANYAAMFPLSNDDLAGIDTYQIGDSQAPVTARVYDNAVHYLGTISDHAWAWHATAHDYAVGIFLPSGGPDVRGDWFYAGPDDWWALDRGPWYSGPNGTLLQWYINWVTNTFANRIDAMNSWHEQQYLVRRWR